MDGAEIDPAPIPSLSSGSVGSRFVSQKDIEAANATRDEQWKAAYARLGQEPPPRPQEDAYDGRSLFERLQQQKSMKQEEWDEKMKLGNQFRGIDEEDSAFLAAVQDERRAQERQQKINEAEELAAFKAGQAKRAAEEAAAAIIQVSGEAGPSKAAVTSKPPQQIVKKQISGGAIKKDQKTLLKGIIRKKPKGKDVERSVAEKPAAPISKTTILISSMKSNPLSQAVNAKAAPVGESKKRRASLVEDDVGSEDESGSEPETKKART
ncbi:hypothetical protein FRB94_013454 [Tulasnella sp. JGI-2019a]|nr:hypothetical protein FRB93_002303 [Tulasnella sp. JGI-2019a]KAG9008292.1 hypothetical protein FRB94_013454 [Tulasnella sp. JGI-2019a]KAG9032719.1 hypothetical protein FRB95_001055 [Tulasnella sp. JGI-2019a]